MAARIACEVPRGDGSDGTFNADTYLPSREQTLPACRHTIAKWRHKSKPGYNHTSHEMSSWQAQCDLLIAHRKFPKII